MSSIGSHLKGLGLAVFIGALGLSIHARGESSPTPNPSVSPSAEPSPDNRPLTHAEKALLLREFKNAQRSAVRAFDHRQRMEFKELDASQKSRLKEWTQGERVARRKFFDENRKGAERRKYMQDYLAREKALRQVLHDERETRKRENDVRLKAVKEDHALKLKEFDALIKQGIRPSESLWPN
jgi:hypothetical protein